VKIIPCDRNPELVKQIASFAYALKTESHKLGSHGLSEREFYKSPIFRGAIESIRGEFAATMRTKKEFVRYVLNYLENLELIRSWDPLPASARCDYTVILNSGRKGVIDLKGCLDGANTTIFERPPDADEFVTWSLCTNPSADPGRNAWSGIHTRLGAEMIERGQKIDGLIIWDWVCGSVGRPCPKLVQKGSQESRATTLGPYILPPPCIYVFPKETASNRFSSPDVATLNHSELLFAFQQGFGTFEEEVNFVDFLVEQSNNGRRRMTRIRNSTGILHTSQMTDIKRVSGSGHDDTVRLY
jgi:hypothetical protein